MQSLKTLSLIIIFFSFSFYGCQEEEPFEKKELNHSELLDIVRVMPEFQLYANNSLEAVDQLIKRRKEISEKEFIWVADIHAKHLTLENLRTDASEKVIERYQDLTTINVLEGDKVANSQFEIFLSAIQEKYIYQINDLTEVLFTLKREGSIEKKWGECMSWCFLWAGTQEQALFNDCINASTAELSCRNESSFAFRYFLRGCTSGCPQDE